METPLFEDLVHNRRVLWPSGYAAVDVPADLVSGEYSSQTTSGAAGPNPCGKVTSLQAEPVTILLTNFGSETNKKLITQTTLD